MVCVPMVVCGVVCVSGMVVRGVCVFVCVSVGVGWGWRRVRGGVCVRGYARGRVCGGGGGGDLAHMKTQGSLFVLNCRGRYYLVSRVSFDVQSLPKAWMLSTCS